MGERNSLKEYASIFDEWEALKIIERVTETEIETDAYYLPHRAVFKISETTKIRPVFDATPREGNNHSLNDCLLKGPNLIELIPDILDRFRMYPIGLSADIEKAFLQISVTPKHRDFLRFFYPHENNEIVYCHCRLVFGVCSSPFLLAASINHLLDNTPSKYMDIISKLRHSFYVDNCVIGVSDTQEIGSFVNKGIFDPLGILTDATLLPKMWLYNAGPVKSESVSLPADRVRDAGVFEVIGIDLAGPLFLKKGEKVWVVLYTCAVYRAVHLELVTALSTNNILLSLRRCIARKGRPSIVYTNNGTNFRGAVREFKNLDWIKIERETEIQRIKWKFNAPTAAWWGVGGRGS
ncbi:integrase catalytic domain-containing protein [Trichonephila clavipes]|uniref:Integrase catalytic domain-containing protein n=1 Tax=Trichonephila clavipes TaxID=2585209 RepID=A0A8X6WKM8_TRICX|nr:integrase catalytic domain-containing protein [Trichonephila clavipes]